MGIKVQYLTDKDGQPIYPRAHADATYDSQGVPVGKRLDAITDELEEVNKSLENISNGEKNIQADWNETDATSDAYIKNKPTIPSLEGYITEEVLDESLAHYTKTEDLEIYDDTELDTRIKTIEDDYLTSVDKTELKNLIPTTLPADGGNADTVNDHTVEADVPKDAVFTDTVYEHPKSGVITGEYIKVTVDENGHIVSGSNPTTLSDFGITDAATNEALIAENKRAIKKEAELESCIFSMENKQSFNKPIFLFVDDDGATQFNELYSEVLEPRNIVGGLAIISKTYDTEYFTYLTQEEILNYQSKGWAILNHSCSGDEIALDNVSTNLPYAIKQFKNLGYENKHNIFVYPKGNNTTDKQAIETKVAEYFSYAFDVAVNGNHEISLPISNKYNMGRIFISADLDDDTKTWIKSCVDSAIVNNSMLIISTHASSYNKEFLCEIIDYIQGLGYDFSSIDEVFELIENNIKQNISDSLSDHTGNTDNPHKVTKEQIGLENVDNTSDKDKPVSTVQQEALDKKVDSVKIGETEYKSGTTVTLPVYTTDEVDNKFSALETNIDWKESVETFDDIATTYPEPKDGWTVNVNDTDYTYRYNGTEWIAISANVIPKATEEVDGLLSKEDKKVINELNNVYATKDEMSENDNSLASDIALNRQTLGYVKKNLCNYEDFTIEAGTNNYAFKNLPIDWGIESNKTYTASFYTDFTDYISLGLMNANATEFGKLVLIKPVDGRVVFTFTTPEDLTKYKRFCIYAGQQASTAGNTLNVWDIQIEVGDTATDYEPYVDDVNTRLENVETEVIPIERGGTGGTTAKEAQYNLLNDMNTVNNEFTDTSLIASVYVTPTKSTGMICKRTALSLWNYIKSKAEAIFAKKEDVTLNRQTLGYTKKNLLKIDSKSDTSNGITYNSDADTGIITLNGTATGMVYIWFSQKFCLKAGTYILSGCPTGGNVDGTSYYRQNLVMAEADGTWIGDWNDYGEGRKFTITQEQEDRDVYVQYMAVVWTGYTAENLAFHPLLRSVDIEDDTFEPYIDDVDTRLKALEDINAILDTI